MEVNLFKTLDEKLVDGTKLWIKYNGHSFIEWNPNFNHVKVVFRRWRMNSDEDEYFIAEVDDYQAKNKRITNLHLGSKFFGEEAYDPFARYAIIHKTQIVSPIWK